MDHSRAQTGLWAQGVGFEPPAAEIFEHLGDDEIAQLKRLHTIRPLAEQDEHLIAPRNPAPRVITLLSGWAIRYTLLADGRRSVLGVVLPGDTLGLDSLLECAPLLPVQCITPVVFGEIGFKRACLLAGEADWFRQLALQAMSRRRRAAEAALVRLGQCTPAERLVATLLEIQDRLTARGLVKPEGFTLPISRLLLADLIGADAATLGQAIDALTARGLLTMEGQRVRLAPYLATETAAIAPRFIPQAVRLPSALLV